MTADSQGTEERRLVAVLMADVVGYSRLMGADEKGTLDRLTAHRREIWDAKIGRHRGRIVKTIGDGLLVEFSSIVYAVRCAIEIQGRLSQSVKPGSAGRRAKEKAAQQGILGLRASASVGQSPIERARD
jgi:class 3 adenylate cyclase